MNKIAEKTKSNRFVSALLLLIGLSGCMTAYQKSLGVGDRKVYSKAYQTNYELVWEAVLESLKSERLDVANRESGLLLTRWKDNTEDKNRSDGAGLVLPYVKAQYRFRIQVSNGVFHGTRAIRVAVMKDQVVQQTALDDLRLVDTNGVEEQTLLYRIGRLVSIRTEMKRAEEERIQREIEREKND